MEELVLARPGKKREEVLEAQKSYNEIMKEIKPFIKKKKSSINPDSNWEICNF